MAGRIDMGYSVAKNQSSLALDSVRIMVLSCGKMIWMRLKIMSVCGRYVAYNTIAFLLADMFLSVSSILGGISRPFSIEPDTQVSRHGVHAWFWIYTCNLLSVTAKISKYFLFSLVKSKLNIFHQRNVICFFEKIYVVNLSKMKYFRADANCFYRTENLERRGEEKRGNSIKATICGTESYSTRNE